MLTSWEGSAAAPDRFPRDLAGVLAAAAFEVDVAAEKPAWLARQLSIYRSAGVAHAADPHDPALRDLAEEGRRREAFDDQARRVVVAARRPV